VSPSHPYRTASTPTSPPQHWLTRFALLLPVSFQVRRRAQGGHWEKRYRGWRVGKRAPWEWVNDTPTVRGDDFWSYVLDCEYWPSREVKP